MFVPGTCVSPKTRASLRVRRPCRRLLDETSNHVPADGSVRGCAPTLQQRAYEMSRICVHGRLRGKITRLRRCARSRRLRRSTRDRSCTGSRAQIRGATGMGPLDRRRLRDRLRLLLHRSLPRLRPAGRPGCGRRRVLRRLGVFHARRGLGAARDDTEAGPAVRRRLVVERRRAVRGDPPLQCEHLRRHQTGLSTHQQNRLVRAPDLVGSGCFLASGALACAVTTGPHLLPAHMRPAQRGHAWSMAAVNLAGCVFFGISAVASFVVPSTGSVLALAPANWCTALGALCFFIGAVLLSRHQPDARHTTTRPPISQEV